jgi:hypothetical protein
MRRTSGDIILKEASGRALIKKIAGVTILITGGI